MHIQWRSTGFAAIALATVAAVGCGGVQSALAPAGRDAQEIANLFGWMAAGALVIWAAVVGLGIYAVVGRPTPHDRRVSSLTIVVGGVIVPTLVLTGLLIYSMPMMPRLLALPPGDAELKIAVSGERWWWRVRYMQPDGSWTEAANEVRLPVGRRVEFILTSPDVIHAFWIPSLGGKMDMIPGRVTRIALEPTRTGRFRGQCAEYCGASHALMAFDVEVMEPEAFEAWLRAQREPAPAASGDVAILGEALFAANGCGACHNVRGTSANGTLGPDLTHVGSRPTVAAGTVSNEADELLRWVRHAPDLKPDARMPPFDALDADELRAIVAYLRELR